MSPPDLSIAPRQRLRGIDILRGAVILLMALDHVRTFFNVGGLTADPLNIAATSGALYVTRWITNFCAPAFILLAGVSAYLYGRKVADRLALSRFLLSRGLWLIALEVTVISFAWHFSIVHPGLGVIWAIGASMAAMAVLTWLPRPVLWAVAVLILAGHNAIDAWPALHSGPLAPAWAAVLTGGVLHIGRWHVFATYAALPWLGFMTLGYLLGPAITEPARAKQVRIIGVAMIYAFIVLRGHDGYGDADPWVMQPSLFATLGSFLDTDKYPPSLLFALMTLGPLLLILPSLEHAKGRFAEVLMVYGRAPLLFYVAHLFLAHALMMAIGVAQGLSPSLFVSFINDPARLTAAHWGFGLPAVYGVWIVVIVALYPLCLWFGRLKARRRDWWLSYL